MNISPNNKVRAREEWIEKACAPPYMGVRKTEYKKLITSWIV